MFFKKNMSSPVDYLIVGLGNPGDKYELTRHNIGFMCLDYLADKFNAKLKHLKFKSLYGECKISSARCILLKPQTYMNESGLAVKAAADFYKIPAEHIVVIFDDISLEPGKIRIRRSGSAGGHNGIKSIIGQLGTADFPRIKIGVGEKPHPDYDLADWVLSRFKKEEFPAMESAVKSAASALKLIVSGETDTAMNQYN